ncbi:MAG TPA: hypothetical protein VGR94_07560 [Candidatus Acidoferrales bacterium]|nr:hypothetical protein [Candidatus Acidoferrales bacterium]HEV2421076.1 hypothetical protein [Candidatus Acidoferrales bacterium]
MQKPRRLGILPLSLCILIWAAGCSHANFNFGGGGGGQTAPMLLTFHDTPAAGITVTSFEVTVSGAVLQPGNVSLLASPQTIELTQLQTNSAFLSTTNVPLATYTSLTITYASPQYTFLNDSGVSVTVGGQPCAAGASCVVTTPTTSTLTLALSSPSFPSVVVGATNQTLLEVDVNLNDIIQSDFSLNFANTASGAVTVTQFTGTAGTTAIGNFNVTGQVASVSTSPTNQFTLTTPAGKTLTIKANAAAFEFARANCTNNNFTCLAAGQIVDANVDIFSDGSLSATEVDFDDASGTQQVSGTIVTENNSPPTSFQMIVHNTIPPVASLPPGTPVTVNIGGTASFVINNGSFVLPIGANFASTSDVIVGQEVEARVASGTSISNGAFTTDRLALEQTQLEANVSSISPQAQPFPFFVFNPLPPLFTQASVGPATQLQVDITGAGQSGGTIFQNLTPLSLAGVTVAQKVTASGFLFNTTGTVGSPTIVATTVRGEVPGT